MGRLPYAVGPAEGAKALHSTTLSVDRTHETRILDSHHRGPRGEMRKCLNIMQKKRTSCLRRFRKKEDRLPQTNSTAESPGTKRDTAQAC